jgi:uncharacterized protein (DUF488 family)
MFSHVSRIFTIGHSTHTLGELIALLRRHEVELLVDVRSFPSSRRLPHFAREALEHSLPAEGIQYAHRGELGGFRKPVPGSPNSGWRTGGFQGYADYMRTGEFEAALESLEAAARARRTALMCAEGLWWRCHRRLIADALTARGWQVAHIDPKGALSDHSLPDFAVVEGTRVSYPAPQAPLDLGLEGG